MVKIVILGVAISEKMKNTQDKYPYGNLHNFQGHNKNFEHWKPNINKQAFLGF